jgi:hypothetical protein
LQTRHGQSRLHSYTSYKRQKANINQAQHAVTSPNSASDRHSSAASDPLQAWTPELLKAFEGCKVSLSRTTLLVHPDPLAPIALITDASTSAMGAVLQQQVKNAWQPLAFFFKKFNPAQQKYSAYDHKLLAIYEAVKHFRHMLEARHFIIFTDHKPITYALQQKQDKCSPRQFNHLDFIAQFTADIQHISGQGNVVADTLSPVEFQLVEEQQGLRFQMIYH